MSPWGRQGLKDLTDLEIQLQEWSEEFDQPVRELRSRFEAYTRQRLGSWRNHRDSFRAMLHIRAQVEFWGHSIDDLSDEEVAEALDRVQLQIERERLPREQADRLVRTTFLRDIRQRSRTG